MMCFIGRVGTVFKCLRISKNIIANGSPTHVKVLRSSTIFTENSIRFFRVNNFLYGKDFQSSSPDENDVENIKKTKHKRLPKEDKSKSSLSSTEKYKNERNKKLNAVHTSSDKLTNNNVRDKSKNSPNVKKKTKGDDVVRFRLKDVISDYDLQHKIEFAYKHLEKGRATCFDISGSGKDQLAALLEKLNNSKLKDHLQKTESSSKNMKVFYQKKVTTVESDEAQDNKTDKSS